MQKIIESKWREQQNKSYLEWSRNAALESSLRRMMLANVRLSYALMLLPLSLLLTACAGPSPVLCRQPAPVQMPALTEPLPQQSYSRSASENFNRWQKKLTGTPATLKP